MKYREKKSQIEAIQLKPDNIQEVKDFILGQPSGISVVTDVNDLVSEAWVPSPGGGNIAKLGDWIVKGYGDIYYPIKPEKFDRIYEPDEN